MPVLLRLGTACSDTHTTDFLLDELDIRVEFKVYVRKELKSQKLASIFPREYFKKLLIICLHTSRLSGLCRHKSLILESKTAKLSDQSTRIFLAEINVVQTLVNMYAVMKIFFYNTLSHSQL